MNKERGSNSKLHTARAPTARPGKQASLGPAPKERGEAPNPGPDRTSDALRERHQAKVIERVARAHTK